MKRPSTFLNRENASSLDQAMTPMIDVIFLLLVFFVCTSSFQIIEKMLPSQMSSSMGTETLDPEMPPPEEVDFDQVVIRIGWEPPLPRYEINGTPVESIEKLREHLVTLAKIKVDAPLVLHPDPPVPIGFVITAYDEAKLAGFQKVSFAVNPQGPK